MTRKSIFLLLLLSVFVLPIAGCWDYGGGEKVGTITRLNRQGLICKTWEGEIIRGGLNTGSGVMGQAFHFTIEDDGLAKEVEKAMNSQQEVKISYKMEAITICRSDSQNYFLTKIEPLAVVSTPPNQSRDIPMVGMTPQNDLILQAIRKQQKLLEQNQKLMQQLVK